MKTFKMLLGELDEVLRKYNMHEYEKLQPPLSDKEIDNNLEELGIHDESIRALFQWKNGEKADSSCQMMIYGGLQSMESIKANTRSGFRLHDPSLIQIISDNGEESILFNKNPSKHYGKLYLYSIPQLYIEHPISYFDSLESMLKTIIEAYKKEAYVYDFKNEWLDIDDEKFNAIAKKINKKSAHWIKPYSLKWEDWYQI